MYTNEKFSRKIYPSITDVIDFMKFADTAEIKSRDTRPLMFLLMRVASASPRVAGLINTRLTSIRSYDWQLNAIDDAMNDKAVATKQRCNSMINTLIQNYINAVLYGIMAVKYEWQYINNELSPVITKYYKPIELDYELDKLVLIEEDSNNKTIIEDNTEHFWFIQPSFIKGGILRSIIFHELLRNETVIEWSNLNKRMKGIIAGIIDSEKLEKAQRLLSLSDEQLSSTITELDKALQYAGDSNYLKTHSYVDIQLKSIVEAAAGGSYAEFKKVLENDIAIALLGQANITELPQGTGSRAALQVQNLIRQDILLADLLSIKEIIDKFLVLDYQKNFDANAINSPFKFDFVFDDNIDIETNARVIETIARSGIGIEVSKSELYSMLGLSIPTIDEDKIVLTSSANRGLFV